MWPLALVVFRLLGGGLDAGRDVRPGTVVEWLLLAPHDLGVRVFVEVRRELVRLLVQIHIQVPGVKLTRS